LIITSQALFADTMFVDGLIYATIAKNLAEGKGTFWNLHFTNTFMSEFHEHPPLAMGLESIYFKLFGTSRFVEKFYSLTTCLLVVFGIMKLWIQLGFQKSTRWSPILFWMFVPVIFWSCNNNLLENTLVIFTTFSVYFALKSTTKKPYYYLILAGFMLSFGFFN
jgi:4-amino-4-deoxy-L-arabinose transferase-like glycosyltransferase